MSKDNKIVDQKAYLQKYLSKDKKKKRKKVVKGSGLKLIDEDVDLSRLRALDADELDFDPGDEDAPQIAGIIDERPEHLKAMETFRSSTKWKIVASNDGLDDKINIEEVKQDYRKKKEDTSDIIFGKMYSDSEDEKSNKNGTNSDLSPLRKKSMKKQEKVIENSSDLSPPRVKQSNKKVRNNSSDLSPPRAKSSKKQEKVRENSSDLSPPRAKSSNKQVRDNSSDLSPPRSRSDIPSKHHEKSKTRKRSRWEDVDRKRSVSVDSDQSLPRIDRNRMKDKSPKQLRKERSLDRRRKKDSDSDSDLSPPRKNQRENEHRKEQVDKDRWKHDRYEESRSLDRRRKGSDRDSDLSPPRKNRRENELRKEKENKKDRWKHDRYEESRSLDKRRKGSDSDSDLSPPRKNRRENEHRKGQEDKKDRWKHDRYEDSVSRKTERTLEGKKAGLQDATALVKENEDFRRREDEMYKKMSADVSGRNAKTVSRNLGKRETSSDREKVKEELEKRRRIEEKYDKWGKGLKQVEDREQRALELEEEGARPLARYKDDDRLDAMLKERDREGDPMLAYIREKRSDRDESAPSRPMYKGDFPPNRYNIRPGYRWDGVDRSNGYEKKHFEAKSKNIARDEEAYKWSTEDL